ncbi:alanine--tRNA ligase [Entomospira culicis]|uniref:Alanine--tRNA ligase n=1 Tax=Entomospira culicis TaxID=2719989 RepID=A0A968GED2_9SPIO|nr:alanine--tRNA ligase [Entomospira culicis]NIZ18826.1 alanine--tRNA ligase [Entomospira culicis]NIZ69041.1 alanine--tRNA ligase [Entomospira culicis]WDI37629.1 alanine--tRNA ligase [Entomospira culicis]WDI39257.1 alanine--tRNA ligase [Entomospira culicis]
MNAEKLRRLFIGFFTQHDHVEISGRSVIPENDPTVLFTTAGMHPLVPYLLGEPHPSGRRLTDVQKCIRTGDIESVGDAHHLTFFEMLGNWSLGDYFKSEMIAMSYQFLTSPDYLGIDPSRLHVTVFAGDDEVPRDEESARLWQEMGIAPERIYFLGREDNWWGPAGQTGPCGPDSEMFLDTEKEPCSAECRPGCSCGKYIEIWNDVFMEYDKQEDGSYLPLKMKNIDTGMGLERTLCLLLGKKNVYDTELFQPIIQKIEEISGHRYTGEESEETTKAFRVIADHIKTATMIMSDERGIRPSNVGQGYILRRLIRRAVRFGRKLGIEVSFLPQLADVVLDIYRNSYPEMQDKRNFLHDELRLEEEQFSRTLMQGEREFLKMLPSLLKNPQKMMSGRLAFKLYDTYGFPIELTEELAREHGLGVDRTEFDAAFAKHQEASKAGADKLFKGGLADDSMASTRYHTATHLLNEALRRVLGDGVHQAGSNITPERLRFDFNWNDKLSEEQIVQVEALVNAQIEANLPIGFEVMSIEEAKNIGAQAMFEGRYDEKVKVYRMGDFSVEVCGGPHVEHTGELGKFKIVKEQSSSRGVRRIKAILVD